MDIVIRHERPQDIPAIHAVTIAAFRNAPHSDHTEHFIVSALRDAGALAISLVAEHEGEISGHVAVSPVAIAGGAEAWYGLGPISVLPGHQGQGVGSELMRAALSDLKNINASGCVLLGDPGFYHRFGFAPVAGLTLPGVPPEFFMATLLQGAYPQGEVTYHAAFSSKG